MREITLVTGIGPNGWEEYGSRTLSTIQRWWPACRFILYSELGCTPKELAGWEIRHAESIPGFSEFQEWCSSSPIFSGRRPSSGHRWKPREIKRGYAIRWDAKKFGKMAIYAADAAAITQTDILVWLDADVETHSDVPKNFIDDMYEAGDYIMHLDRDWSYSETGFISFNTQHDLNESFMKLFLSAYFNGSFKYLGEFHDCYVFDFIRKLINVPCKSITKDVNDRYLFDSSILGKYMRHDKGPERKAEINKPFSIFVFVFLIVEIILSISSSVFLVINI